MCCFLHAQTPTYQNDTNWQLKWEDNFDTFNANRWIKADSSGNDGRPQLYLANQVYIENGNLVLELNNTAITCPNPVPFPVVCEKCIVGKQYKYRSGYVQTQPSYNTRFGYIEARIKFPYSEGEEWGFWPAFWVWRGDGVSNPTNAAEIDICEIFARNRPPNRFTTATIRKYNPSDFIGVSHEFSNFSYADWHTYAIEWDKDRIIWYLDGKAIYSQNNHKVVDPVRIKFNFAVLKENEKKYQPPTSPPFQEYMYVDYVKVYQLKCDKNSVVNEISNFNTYNYAVKKSISLSNATTIPANSNITLRATDFIELKAGFTVDTGRELYLDVTPCEGAIATQLKREE